MRPLALLALALAALAALALTSGPVQVEATADLAPEHLHEPFRDGESKPAPLEATGLSR